MQEDLADTLAELERKLQELEQTLNALSAGGPAGEPPRAEPSPPPAQPRLEPWAPTTSGPGPPVEQAAPAATHEPDGQGRSRIVDETIEPSAGTRGGYAQQRAGGSAADAWQAEAAPAGNSALSDAPGAPDPLPRTSTAPPPSTPPPRSMPPAPSAHHASPPAATAAGSVAPTAPSTAELLGFRERLERAARELTHDYDELLGRLSYAAVPATTGPTISFARGAPSLDIIDVEGLRHAATWAFKSDPAGATAYGTAVGYPRLRSWIAERHGVEPERVLVTNGSMQADAFLFEQLVRPGEEVIVERPSYDRTLLSLRQRGARLHAVELQPDGIDVDELERLLEGGTLRRPRLAHIIPNFQNPAGYTLSLEKRRRLLELAAEHDFIVFEDDPYVELRFSGETLPTMLSMDPERVVYASSFSKTVCPGVRVGYLVGPPDLIGGIAQLATNTYISPNMVAQAIVYEFCASRAIDHSIETVRSALAERAETLANALRRELPEAQFVPPQGGYFMWVTLPPETDVAALYHAAAERGVSFVKGTDFVLDGGENTLRLAYSGVTPEQIEVGVARLAEAYRLL
jgi:2-aminoadipate transaminase